MQQQQPNSGEATAESASELALLTPSAVFAVSPRRCLGSPLLSSPCVCWLLALLLLLLRGVAVAALTDGLARDGLALVLSVESGAEAAATPAASTAASSTAATIATSAYTAWRGAPVRSRMWIR